MKVEIEQVSQICKKMSVALPPELVDQEVDKAYLNLQKQVKIKGFRPGKAPLPCCKGILKHRLRKMLFQPWCRIPTPGLWMKQRWYPFPSL